jgi:hypothetical protein
LTRTSIIPIALIHDTGKQIRINMIAVTVKTVKTTTAVDTAVLRVRFVVTHHWVIPTPLGLS